MARRGVGLRPAFIRTSVEVSVYPLNPFPVSTVKQLESELRDRSHATPRAMRDRLNRLIEHKSQFTPDFERSILRSGNDVTAREPALVRQPQGR
jgi:hypothetical protein